jgi:hypothetical protein
MAKAGKDQGQHKVSKKGQAAFVGPLFEPSGNDTTEVPKPVPPPLTIKIDREEIQKLVSDFEEAHTASGSANKEFAQIFNQFDENNPNNWEQVLKTQMKALEFAREMYRLSLKTSKAISAASEGVFKEVEEILLKAANEVARSESPVMAAIIKFEELNRIDGSNGGVKPIVVPAANPLASAAAKGEVKDEVIDPENVEDKSTKSELDKFWESIMAKK